jgi:hypothetical protein
MPEQYHLIPVSPQEFTQAAYDLAMLLQQIDEEDSAWEEAKKAHKETLAALRQGVAEKRQLIRRAQLEHEEGITARQVNALLDEATERGL